MVELMTGMLLFVIIAAAASALFVPMLNIYIRANEAAECNTLLDSAANRIIGDLSSITEPVLPDKLGETNSDMLEITVNSPADVTYSVDSDGVLHRNGDAVLPKGYYKNKSVSFYCDPVGSDKTAYILTVRILAGGEEMMSREYAVMPLRLNQY